MSLDRLCLYIFLSLSWIFNAVLVGFIISLVAYCIFRDLNYTKDLQLYVISMLTCVCTIQHIFSFFGMNRLNALYTRSLVS